MFNFVHTTDFLEPKVTQENGVRFYKFPNQDKYYPSVTSVTGIRSKQGILEWRKRVGEQEANRVSAAATSRGNAFHNYSEKYLKSTLCKEDKDHPLAWYMFSSAKPHLDRINNIHCLETPLWSDYLGLAGRVDCIAEFDGELAVIDFKTSTKPKRESWIENYFVQETAYAAMFLERTGLEVKKIVTLVAVEKDNSIQIFEKYNIDDYLQLLKSYIEEFARSQHE
jgi:ATP-dependent exoDNAse (exonuclease V) beta subunit